MNARKASGRGKYALHSEYAPLEKTPLLPAPGVQGSESGSWRSVLILMRGRLYNTAGVLRQDAWPLRAKALAEDAVRPCSLQAVRLCSPQVKARWGY